MCIMVPIISLLLVRDDSLADPLFLPVKLKWLNCRSTVRFTMLYKMIHLPIHSFSIETINDQPNDPHYIFQ